MAIEGTLYVVCHGLITLVRRKGSFFQGFFVDMGDEHEYLAGSWLNERPIPPHAELELLPQGLAIGHGDLDPDKCLHVKVQGDIDARAAGMRRIKLPLPKTVHHLFTGKIAESTLSDPSLPSSTNMSAVTVFEYDVEKFSSPILVSMDGVEFWAAVARTFSGDRRKVATLHLYNEPRNVPDEAHLLLEFKKSFELLGHRLEISEKIEITRQDKPVPCLGLRRLELHDLVLRERVVTRVSQLVLDLEHFPGADSIGSEPAVCGGGGGCGEC